MICLETCCTLNNGSHNTNYFTNQVKKMKNYFRCGSLKLVILLHFMPQVIRLYVNLTVL